MLHPATEAMAEVAAEITRLTAELKESRELRVLVGGVYEPVCFCDEPSVGMARGYESCRRCGGLLRLARTEPVEPDNV